VNTRPILSVAAVKVPCANCFLWWCAPQFLFWLWPVEWKERQHKALWLSGDTQCTCSPIRHTLCIRMGPERQKMAKWTSCSHKRATGGPRVWFSGLKRKIYKLRHKLSTWAFGASPNILIYIFKYPSGGVRSEQFLIISIQHTKINSL